MEQRYINTQNIDMITFKILLLSVQLQSNIDTTRVSADFFKTRFL
jgi:hypothetical protein